MTETIRDEAGIHLLPCTSAEEQDAFERLVDDGLQKKDLTEGPPTAELEERSHLSPEAEFEALRTLAGDEDRVLCWPIQESTWEQQRFGEGDVALFYQGSYQYNRAAIVSGALEAPSLANLLFENSDDDHSRPVLLVFEEVFKINIHSPVVAEYADLDLDYIVSPTSLSSRHLREILRDYGTIAGFIEAARTGIAKRPLRTQNEDPEVGETTLLELNRLEPADEDIAKESEPEPDETSDGPGEIETDASTPERGEPRVTDEDVNEVEADEKTSKSSTQAPTDTPSEDGQGRSTTEPGPGTVESTDSTSAGSPDVGRNDIGTDSPGRPAIRDVTTQPGIDPFTGGVPAKASRPGEVSALREGLSERKLFAIVGPKNTGKRAMVRRAAETWINDDSRVPAEDRIVVTNFRSDLTYQEFVIGHRDESGGEHVPITGEFGRFCDLAAADAQQHGSDGDTDLPRYVMIIEDFHTVDATTVFGNLWQTLQPENRGRENRVSLTGTEVNLWVPRGLAVVGIIDTNYESPSFSPAVRRSFGVMRTTPDYQALARSYDFDSESELEAAVGRGSLPAMSILALVELNERIRSSSELGPDYLLGERYLCRGGFDYEPLSESRIQNAWSQEIFVDLSMYYRGGVPEMGTDLLSDLYEGKLTPRAMQSADAIVELVEALAQARLDGQ